MLHTNKQHTIYFNFKNFHSPAVIVHILDQRLQRMWLEKH